MQALTLAADYAIRGEAIGRQSPDHGLGSMMVEGRIRLVPVFSIARERLDGCYDASMAEKGIAPPALV
jgi:hypothetical protein